MLPNEGNVMAKSAEYMAGFETEMVSLVEDADQYAWSRGEQGGHKIGFSQMMQKLEGIQSALYFIAGQTNQGKTLMLNRLGWDLATMNGNQLHVRNYTLDDSCRRVLPRVAAMNMDVPISAMEKPRMHIDNEVWMSKREQGMKLLRDNAYRFSMIGETGLGSTNIEDIEIDLQSIMRQTEERSLVTGIQSKVAILIDSFHKVTTKKTRDKSERFEIVVNELNRMVGQYDMPIIVTAELRKLNGFRRPTLEDVRETCESAYRADCIILAYSEIGISKPNASIYHIRSDDPTRKYPVLEAHFAKNKTSDFKGHLFYKLYPEKSAVAEATVSEAESYISNMYG